MYDHPHGLVATFQNHRSFECLSFSFSIASQAWPVKFSDIFIQWNLNRKYSKELRERDNYRSMFFIGSVGCGKKHNGQKA
jgi:hypothetical protein